MKIEQSTSADIDTIFALYAHAVQYQLLKGATPWPTFDRSLVASEVEAGRQ